MEPPANCKPWREGRSAGQQKAKLREIAAVQGQIDNLAVMHGLTQVVGGRQKRRVRFDLHGLLRQSHLKVHGHLRDLIDAQADAFLHVFAKSLRGNLQPVVANRQQHEQVIALRIAYAAAGESSFRLNRGDLGRWHARAAGV